MSIQDYQFYYMFQAKIFPLRLPQGFHGPLKPVKAVNKCLERGNPQESEPLHLRWRRLDKDVMREQRDYVSHPSKLSETAPDWMRSTAHWFRRGAIGKAMNESRFEREQYNVLNMKKKDPFAWTSPARVRDQIGVTGKVGQGRRVGVRVGESPLTEKVGISERRDYTKRRPCLKVGSSLFVDTYET